MADHTIQVGTNQAFAILGIPAGQMKLGRAPTLKDATVLSVEVKKSWTGENVRNAFERVFKKNGFPGQVAIDGASNLKKGILGVTDGTDRNLHVTYDITHLIANLLKKKYNGRMKSQRVMEKLALTTKRIAQTEIGYLVPPKIREKARFLNLPRLATWLGKIVAIKGSSVRKGNRSANISTGCGNRSGNPTYVNSSVKSKT